MATVVYGKDPWTQFGDKLAEGAVREMDPERQARRRRMTAIDQLRESNPGMTLGQAQGQFRLNADPLEQLKYDIKNQFGYDQAKNNVANTQAQTENLAETTHLMAGTLAQKVEHDRIQAQYQDLLLGQNIQEHTDDVEQDRHHDAQKISEIVGKFDSDLSKQLPKTWRPSDKASLYLGNAANKLTAAQLLQTTLDDTQKIALSYSVVSDVLQGLSSFKASNDVDGQRVLFQKAIDLFKPYRGTEQQWIWDSFMNMTNSFRPLSHPDEMGFGGTHPGATFWEKTKDALGQGPDETYDPQAMIREATQ